MLIEQWKQFKQKIKPADFSPDNLYNDVDGALLLVSLTLIDSSKYGIHSFVDNIKAYAAPTWLELMLMLVFLI